MRPNGHFKACSGQRIRKEEKNEKKRFDAALYLNKLEYYVQSHTKQLNTADGCAQNQKMTFVARHQIHCIRLLSWRGIVRWRSFFFGNRI